MFIAPACGFPASGLSRVRFAPDGVSVEDLDAAAREDDHFTDLVLQANTGEALGVDARGLEVGARQRLGLGGADPQPLFRAAVLASVFDSLQGGHKRSFRGLVRRRRMTQRSPERGVSLSAHLSLLSFRQRSTTLLAFGGHSFAFLGQRARMKSGCSPRRSTPSTRSCF
jgi:hypothetical protein